MVRINGFERKSVTRESFNTGAPSLLNCANNANKSKQLSRVMLYSHDTMGLGHFRRNLLIAQALSQSQCCENVLLVTGINTINSFPMPDGVDCLTLPALYKEKTGAYRPRTLNIELNELVEFRANAIKSALKSFQPEVFIVDNVPLGVMGELEPSLEYVKANKRIHSVLGLRDILDCPRAVENEWLSRNNNDAIDKFYSEVWIYGDESFFNPVQEYSVFNCFAEKVRFTGYFDRTENRYCQQQHKNKPSTAEEFDLPDGKLALCVVGGGQDGSAVAQAFSKINLPQGYNGLLVTGPFMPRDTCDEVNARLADSPRWRVLEFHKDPIQLLIDADAVVSMAGYNTVSEILSLGKPAFIVPRTEPRLEQKIRAQRLDELGLAKMCLPEELSSIEIETWLEQCSGDTALTAARSRIDFNGLTRIPKYLRDLVEQGGDNTSETRLPEKDLLLPDPMPILS